jgi:hypothetical protein
MNIIDELGDIYNDFDNTYAAIEFEASARGWHRKEAKYQTKRALNDQAYFLFMFTRLEDKIKTLATQVIDYKSNLNYNYQNERAWQMLKQRNDRDKLNLMECVSFLVTYNSRDYHLIMRYKQQRDTLAHGGIVPTINMTAAINDISRLYDNL